MKKSFVFVAGAMAISSAAFAAQETCYQVSPDGTVWSKTPESICVEAKNQSDYTITLKTGLSFSEQTVATFNLSLLEHVRCADCNKDVFGLASPSNSTFNALRIRFDGQRSVQTGEESGTLSIGKTKLYYRSYK